MALSNLQKYILLKAYEERGKFGRDKLLRFYATSSYAKATTGKSKKPKKEDRVNIITKSLERLVDREFLIGYGTRTPHKWFIKEIRLTKKGEKEAKRLLGEQQKLPFKKLK